MNAGNRATVVNAGLLRGHSGRLLDIVESRVLAAEPDLVALMAGTAEALDPETLLPAERFERNLAALCAAILPRARLLLLTAPPCHLDDLYSRTDWRRYGDTGPLERLTRINAATRRLAAERGLPLADTHRIFSAVGNIGEAFNSFLRNRANAGERDGVHPTPHGNLILAAAVHDAILRHRLPARRVVCLGDALTYGPRVAGAGTSGGDTYPARLAELLAARAPPRTA